ncbi:MAG TPA: IPT/TIG domain-containing protein [Candidatus Paceibacterota bacterium]|nr:IPT/TIG domain-containing protein [Candidatus Paceibacterota bacterium]
MQPSYKSALGAISLIAVLSTATVSTARAQSIYPTLTAPVCVNLSTNLSAGARGSDVLHLQQFLVNENFPGGGSWMETGYYGAATVAAVKDFQQEYGLPQTGIADALTRSEISQLSCGPSSILGYVPPSAPSYPAIPWNQYGNSWNTNQSGTNYPPNVLVSLNLTGLSQNTGSPGEQVTIYGTGFDAVNNTVNFGPISLPGLTSNGTSLTFTVPFYQSSGTVNLTVTNSLGTSNTLTFTVYSYSVCGDNYFYGYNGYNQCGCSYGTYPYSYTTNSYSNCGSYYYPNSDTSAPTIVYLTPNSGAVGTTVTVMGTGFTQTGNSVHFGAGVIANLISTDGRSVSFQVPSQLVGYGEQNVGLSSYSVSVTNGNGYSTNSVPFTVTSLSANGTSNVAPSISYLSPNSGYVGQQVTIYGSNLGSSDTIYFGNGAIQNVSGSGSQVTFTIPSYVTPFCASGYACPTYAEQITPGSYNVSVMNSYGTSNVLSFQVL